MAIEAKLIEPSQIPWAKRRSIENADRSRMFSFVHGDAYSRVKEGKGWVLKHYTFRTVTLSNQAFYSSREPGHLPFYKTTLMQAIEREYKDGTDELIVKIDAMDPEDLHNCHTVSYPKDGKKEVSSSWNPISFEDVYPQAVRDLTTFDKLPDRIDTIATAKAFLQQAVYGNFIKPQLILPK
jgi:hypothetical protein